MIKLIDVFYPRTCPVCTKTLQYKGESVCPECRKKLPYITGNRCMKCGKGVENSQIEYCYDCSRRKHEYESGMGLFSYNEDIKKSIYRFKYYNKREYGKFYGDEMTKFMEGRIRKWDADAIIPVPLHKSRLTKRGYNQSEIIARVIGKNMDIPVYTDVLIRNGKTKPQKELSDEERRKNVENAFKIDKNIVELNRIILVDDIYTTGSTIDACARVLKDNGVKRVYYISLSIGTGF